MNMRTAKPVNLALQGGGAHGAFTWGVLDYLLEHGLIRIDAISGTSAGAMNAVVLASGYEAGGADGARQALADFWEGVADVGRWSPIQRTLIDVFMGQWSLENSPGYLMMDLLGRIASPYDVNPLNINPLRPLLEEHVDFDRVRRCSKMQLFLSATNVETGRVKVFTGARIDADVVLASACLPFLFQAVEIDGAPYWDGGYMGNPVLFPFFNACATNDVVIVQINPIERKGVPRSAREILDRVNEITFNASLLREFRAIDFVGRMLEEGRLDPARYNQVRVHIVGDARLQELGASSKLNTEWRFLQHLRDIGRDAARHWAERDLPFVGKRATVDLRALFQGAGRDSPFETDETEDTE
ncbi:MAG: patatin-like phospholipase family protein [Pseudomonadota bacterium]|nr:patatin-like phospholipase family protein [Pseudomonadota bacterium]